MFVKINKSSGLIEYDDNKNTFWEGDIIFRSNEKDIVILGSAHKLSAEERSNIITEILNKYFFGNYINRDDYIYMYKLKNRNAEKREEDNMTGKSFPILSETIIELPKNIEEDERITQFRNIYMHLKLAVKEAMQKDKDILDDIDYEFYGTILEYRRYKSILNNLIPDFEYSLSNLCGRKLEIEYISKYKSKKTIFSFRIKEV